MTKKIQPLKLEDKTLDVRSKMKLCTTRSKQHIKKMKVKTKTKLGETKITRLRHNLFKIKLSPRKRIPLIIPKPLKVVYSIASEEVLLRRKPKSRIENPSGSPPSNSLSGVSSVNVCEDFSKQNNLNSFSPEIEKSLNENFNNSISKENSNNAPLPQLLESPRNVEEYCSLENNYFREDITTSDIIASNINSSNCSSTSEKLIKICEELCSDVEENNSVTSSIKFDTDDELPDLMS